MGRSERAVSRPIIINQYQEPVARVRLAGDR